MAETSRRFNPYNYAYNNPVSFIDPDGRKAYAPDRWTWNTPTNGALGYMMGGGSATFGSFDEFLGQRNPFAGLGGNTPGGGGAGISSAMINNMINIGGNWTNTGFGFENLDHISLGYDGSYLSLNTALDDYINIPEIVLNGSSSSWGMQAQNNFNSYMKKWNGETGVYGAIGSFTSYTANLVNSFIGTTNETFYSFSGGTNEYILGGYGRSSTFKGLDGFLQFGIDIQGLHPSEEDSTMVHATVFDPYPHDSAKTILQKNIINEQQKFNKSIDSLNEATYKKGWHYKTYGW
ncbi:RHS repeat-associated core domain-containing protein [Chryseobacterium sp. CT-SW4]|uniref:hypothetical protein n=1 Tax=Chryseobacterium sp. SW-1 TaxID=3157343 RepID=UPI003B016E16